MSRTKMKSAAGCLALLLLSLCFTGCTGTIAGMIIPGLYPDGDRYSVGGAETDGVFDTVEVSWITGLVTVVPSENGKISFRETANAELTPETQLHWYADGSVLHIRFAASTTKPLPIKDLQKELILELPADACPGRLDVDTSSGNIRVQMKDISFDEVRLHTASGSAELTAASAQKVRLDSASGTLRAELDTADRVEADTASGNIILTLGSVKKLETSSSSGDADVRFADAEEISLGSASGVLTVTGTGSVQTAELGSSSGRIRADLSPVRELEIDSASGDVEATLRAVPAVCDIHTASGKVEPTLPADADLTLNYDSASGDMDCAFPAAIRGSRYVIGSGAADFSIDTASGDLYVRMGE